MWPFRKRWIPLLGIDISSTVVKVLELSKQPDERYRVESYAVEILKEGAVSERNIINVNLVGEAIKEAVKKSGTRTKFAAVAVPASAVMTKEILVDASLNKSVMEEEIKVQAEAYLPFELDEVFFDFQVMKISQKDPTKKEVLLAASRRDYVDMRVEALAQGGLIAKVVDIEAYSMERAFTLIHSQLKDHEKDKNQNKDTGRTVVLADVGASVTTIVVLHNNLLIYNREEPFGGNQLTNAIAKEKGASVSQAGQMKREGGASVSDQIEVFKNDMAKQVERSLAYFKASHPQYNEIDSIVLSGGCASTQNIEEMIRIKTGVPTFTASPFSNMSISPQITNLQKLSTDAPTLMIACGLTLRSFDSNESE